MEEQLKQLKSTLKALVVSSATTVDVRTLLRDYKSLVGGPLPLEKFSYRDPVKFLIECCHDCFLFQGNPSNPVLTLIVTDNLKHIDQMVRSQKVPSHAKYKGKRQSVPVAPVIRPASTTRNPMITTYREPVFSKEHSNSVEEYQPSTALAKFYKKRLPQCVELAANTDTNFKDDADSRPSTSSQRSTSKEARVDNLKSEILALIQDAPNSRFMFHISEPVSSKESSHSNSVEEYQPSTALAKFYKKRLPQCVELAANTDTNFKDDADSRLSISSQRSTSKEARVDKLKSELLALIQDAPDGIWCTDLRRLYQERYGQELSFNGFGHTSLISFVFSMEALLSITRPVPTGDWLLQDPARLPPAGGIERTRRAASGFLPTRSVRRAAFPRADAADTDDCALPGVDFEPYVFPADRLHLAESVPAASLEGLKRGDTVEVVVGEVYSPSHFWIIRAGTNHKLAMEAITDEMTKYYSSEPGRGRFLPRGAVRVGQYCSSVYANDWHRSVIVQLVDSDTVKVRHVDYGTVDTVPVRELKPLRRSWAHLSSQGTRARLAGARPYAAGRRWPRSACHGFLQLVYEKRLYANIIAIDREEDILELFLIDTTGKHDLCLTSELVRTGHAAQRRDSALTSPDCYLYPTFEALENGETPNYADIHRYLRDGILLDCVEAYRRHVPPALPPTEPAPALYAPAPALPAPAPALYAPVPPAPPAPALYAPVPPAPALYAPVPPASPPPALPAPAPPAPDLSEVLLSEAEWGILTYLRKHDPHAAHFYLLSVTSRRTSEAAAKDAAAFPQFTQL